MGWLVGGARQFAAVARSHAHEQTSVYSVVNHAHGTIAEYKLSASGMPAAEYFKALVVTIRRPHGSGHDSG